MIVPRLQILVWCFAALYLFSRHCSARTEVFPSDAFAQCTSSNFGTCDSNETVTILDISTEFGGGGEVEIQFQFGSGDLSEIPAPASMFISVSAVTARYQLRGRTAQSSPALGLANMIVPDFFAYSRDCGENCAQVGGDIPGCPAVGVCEGCPRFSGSSPCNDTRYKSLEDAAVANGTVFQIEGPAGCGFTACGSCITTTGINKRNCGCTNEMMFWMDRLHGVYDINPTNAELIYNVNVTVVSPSGTDSVILNSISNSIDVIRTGTGDQIVCHFTSVPTTPSGQIADDGFGIVTASAEFNANSTEGTFLCNETPGTAVEDQTVNPNPAVLPNGKWLWWNTKNDDQNRFENDCNGLGLLPSAWLTNIFSDTNICPNGFTSCVPGLHPPTSSNPTVQPVVLREAMLTQAMNPQGPTVIDGRPNFHYNRLTNNAWCHDLGMYMQPADSPNRGTVEMRCEIRGTFLGIIRFVAPGEVRSIGDDENDCVGVVQTNSGSIRFDVCNTGTVPGSYTARLACDDPAYSITGNALQFTVDPMQCEPGEFTFEVARGNMQPEQGAACTITLEDGEFNFQNELTVSCREVLQPGDVNGTVPGGPPGSAVCPGGFFQFTCEDGSTNFLLIGIIVLIVYRLRCCRIGALVCLCRDQIPGLGKGKDGGGKGPLSFLSLEPIDGSPKLNLQPYALGQMETSVSVPGNSEMTETLFNFTTTVSGNVSSKPSYPSVSGNVSSKPSYPSRTRKKTSKWTV